MLAPGSGCRQRRGFARWPAHLLLCGPGPDRPGPVPAHSPGLGTPDLWDKVLVIPICA